MAETKYGKYIINTKPKPGEKQEGLPDVVARAGESIIPGSNHFIAHRISPWFVPPPHGPHIHLTAEILVMLGTDANDPWDLGGEVRICMGKEMEEHVITTSALVFIPAKFIHCPISYHNVTRPFIFMQDQYSPRMTEKPIKNLIPEEERLKMVSFDMDGTE